MDDNNFYKDSVRVIYELMQTTFGDRINEYYLGAPDEIAEAAFPCIIVQKLNSNVTVGATGTDSTPSQIAIHLLLNTKDDMNSSLDVDTTMRKLQDMVEGKKIGATGLVEWMPGTVMYAIRSAIDLGATIINNDASIQYDVTRRQDQPAIKEAMITINTTERVYVPNRS